MIGNKAVVLIFCNINSNENHKQFLLIYKL